MTTTVAIQMFAQSNDEEIDNSIAFLSSSQFDFLCKQ